MKAIIELDNYIGLMFEDQFQASRFLDSVSIVKAEGYGDSRTWQLTEQDRFDIICIDDNSPKLPGNIEGLREKMKEMENDWREDRRAKYQAQEKAKELEEQIAELKAEIVELTNHKEE